MSTWAHLFALPGETCPNATCGVSLCAAGPHPLLLLLSLALTFPVRPVVSSGAHLLCTPETCPLVQAVWGQPGWLSVSAQAPGTSGPLHSLPHGLGSRGLWRLYREPLWGRFSDPAPGQGLENLAPSRAPSVQAAGTRPPLSLGLQSPPQPLRPNLLTAVL